MQKIKSRPGAGGTMLLGAVAMLAAGLFLGAAACAEAQEAAAPAAAPEVLATVGGRQISAAEVESLVASDLLQLDQQRHQVMENGLRQRVDQVVRELEAEAAGVTVEELVAREVDSKLTPPTDAQVDAFYAENQARINQPKEQIADRIRQFLQQQQRTQLWETWMGTLRDKYEVATYLEPFRIAVAADGFPSIGPADAAVTIVEFSDFECPYCGRIAPTLKQVVENYDGKVRFVFRQFPLNIHPNAQKAAEASLCANDQGKFWEMHDAMFANQRALAVDNLKAKAVELGLDAATFNECLDSGRHAQAVAADLAAGESAGVSGTPAMFINGRFASGAMPYEQLAAIVDDELGEVAE